MPRPERSSQAVAVKRSGQASAPAFDRERHRRPSRSSVVRRLVPLLVAAVVLYGVEPAILEMIGAYRRLRDVDPGWWIVVVAASAASTWCMCSL
jgi:hypothetical protein